MTAQKLGVWLDHDHALLTEFTTDPMVTKKIESRSTHQTKEESLRSSGEKSMHTKEQHQQAEYYKKLGEEIRNYSEVVLFGPSSAKTELLNTLKSNHLFANIKMKVEQVNKMTENQRYSFVRKHFSHS